MPLVNGEEQQDATATAVDEVKDVTNAAESSPADEKKDDVKAPKSMLEAVQDAVKVPEAEEIKDEKGAESSTAETGKEDESKSTDAKDGKDASKEDEKLPFAKHPRWQEVLHENRMLKAKSAAHEQVAQEFEEFRGSVRKMGLTSDEIDTGFEIMQAMKRDPAKAYELLKPYLGTLQAFVGEALPDDLQAEVDAGTLNLERAKETARLRATSAHREAVAAQDAKDAERDAQTSAEEKQRQFGDACATAVAAEEKRWQETDPDYPKKAKLVDAQVTKLLSEKGDKIRTVNDAVALAREAKKIVEDELTPILGRREAKRTVTGGGSSANTKAAPTTLLEAMKNAVET